eukprot:6194236-Pleurochrysis_carterae.AAC.2
MTRVGDVQSVRVYTKKKFENRKMILQSKQKSRLGLQQDELKLWELNRLTQRAHVSAKQRFP